MNSVKILMALLCAFLISTSCGGGSIITEELTLGQTFDEQVRLLNPFGLTDSDVNGITGSATVNGINLEEGETPTITVPVGTEAIQVSFAVLGHNFVGSGGVRADQAITDLRYADDGDVANLCTAITAVAGLKDLVSDLSVPREQAESIGIEGLRQTEDRIVPMTVTLSVDPQTAQQIVGVNLGIEEIPAERRTEITRNRNNASSIIGLVTGFIIRAALGDAIGAASGVVEIACGDPTVTLHASLLIEGYGSEPDPEPEKMSPVAILSATSATTGEAPHTVSFDASDSYDLDGTINKVEWFFYGSGGTSFEGPFIGSHEWTDPGPYLVWVRVTDNDGLTDWSDAGIDVLVTNPVVENLSPTAVLEANPSSGELNLGELYVMLDASGSSDPENLPMKYQFSFGDGTEATGWLDNSSTLHYYTEDGSFIASVNVQDSAGQFDSTTTTIVVTEEPGGGINYELFIAGTAGPLLGGSVRSLDETGSLVFNVIEWHGDDGSNVSLNSSQVQFDSDLPSWCWNTNPGELMTVLYAEPLDPDLDDPGNIFINPGSYEIQFSATHQNGDTDAIDFTLNVIDRTDWPPV